MIIFKRQGKQAFTLVELLVSATILVILTSVGFYSYTKNISDARDSVRKTNIASLSSQLNLYKKERGAFPRPGDNFEILNDGYVVAYQGYMNKKVPLSTANNLPLDPELDIPYLYATTKNRQEFQLALTFENSDNPYTMVSGSYASVSRDVLPNILLATGSTSAVEIRTGIGNGTQNRKLFLFNTGYHNLPYDFETGEALSDNTSFNVLLTEVSDDYWQNSDYRSCGEIASAAKRITADGKTDIYQILNSTGSLINQSCSCSSTGCIETP